MTFKNFFIGLTISFGIPWLFLIFIPFLKMRNIKPISFDEQSDGKTGYFESEQAGSIAHGSEIYGENACYVCHSQVIRPSYAGSEIWRKDWAGEESNYDGIDTRRESTIWDYSNESFAHIGLTRIGPDLSNVGYRLESKARSEGISVERYVIGRLLNPRQYIGNHWSICPSNISFFKPKKDNEQSSFSYLDRKGRPYYPNRSGVAIASYLMSLKRADKVPDSINYSRNKLNK